MGEKTIKQLVNSDCKLSKARTEEESEKLHCSATGYRSNKMNIFLATSIFALAGIYHIGAANDIEERLTPKIENAIEHAEDKILDEDGDANQKSTKMNNAGAANDIEKRLTHVIENAIEHAKDKILDEDGNANQKSTKMDYGGLYSVKNNQIAVTVSCTMENVPQKSVTYRVVECFNDKGTGAKQDCSAWKPICPEDQIYVGIKFTGHRMRPLSFSCYKDDLKLFAKPVSYTKLWDDRGSGARYDRSIWRPVPPPGFICVSDVAILQYPNSKTTLDPNLFPKFRCVRKDFAKLIPVGSLIWSDAGSGARSNVHVYHIAEYGRNGKGYYAYAYKY